MTFACQSSANTAPVIVPRSETVDEGGKRFAIRDFAQINGLRAKICNSGVAVPMFGFVRIVTRAKLQAALSVDEKCTIRPQVIYDDVLVIIHCGIPFGIEYAPERVILA